MPLWASIVLGLLGLWSLISLAAVHHSARELAKEKDATREDRWQLNNARERFERLRLKGILTPETRLPLSERRAEPMPQKVTAPATPEEGARLLAALWDVLHLVDEGAPAEDVRERLRGVLGQGPALVGYVSHPSRAVRLAELDRASGRPRRGTDSILWLFGMDEWPKDVRQHAAGELRAAYDRAYDAPRPESPPGVVVGTGPGEN